MSRSNFGTQSGRSTIATRDNRDGVRRSTVGRRTFGNSTGQRIGGATGVRRGGDALSLSSSLPDSYRSAYRRPEHDAGRIGWYKRNNYPSPAYGIGYGLHDTRVSARSGYYRGFKDRHHGYYRHDRYSRRGSSLHLGIHINRGGDYCYRGSYWRPYYRDYCGGYYNNYYFSYGRRWCAPYYRTTSFIYTGCSPWYDWWWPTWGYGLYGGVYFDDDDDYEIEYEPTYITNNYYTDAATPSATQVPAAYTSVATGGVVTSTSADASRDLALQAFGQGNFDLARREFVQALLAEPDDPELVMLYGYAHFATGDWLVAALSIRRAIEADATLIDRPIDISSLYPSRSDYQAHLNRLDSYLAGNRRDIDARFLAGFVRYAAGNPDGAIPDFAECASLAPGDSTYLILRDAAMRASVSMQAAQRAAEDAARSAATSIDPD